MRRAMTNMFMHIKSLENKINDIDILFAEFVAYMKKSDSFEKFLNGKYKQEEHKRSRGDSAPSKK